MKTFYAVTWAISIRKKALAILLANLTILSVGRSQTAGNWNFNNTLSGTSGSSITASPFSLGAVDDFIVKVYAKVWIFTKKVSGKHLKSWGQDRWELSS